ncbi:MAG: aminotransferase class V-fold PLP-dependent enzyme [Ignavibacteriaceae bacterium]
MNELLDYAKNISVDFLESLDNRPVYPSQESLEQLKMFAEALPQNPTDPVEVISYLNKYGSASAVASAGRRYFGFVIGGSLPASLAANWIASAWDQNAGLGVTSPVNAFIEQTVSKWLTEILPVSKNATAGFVTGVTMANFCGLAAARHNILKKLGWNVEADGLFNAPPIKIIVGEEAHGSLLKALSLIGFGYKRVIKVPVDDQGRMIAAGFPEVDENTIVCLQAGNVNTGSFDPVAEIIPLAKSKGAWVHVDGAFGLWAGASEKHSHLTNGMEEADSWATDAHKWLNVPYDSGIVLVKDNETLRAAMSMTGNYLDQSGERVPYQYTPELSRRARAIEIWAAIKSLGRKGISELIERNCAHALMFATELKKAGYEILNDVVINQVLVSFGSDSVTDKVVQEIQKDGTCWMGTTIFHGRRAMRISVSSWATTDEDVTRSIDAIVRMARKFT